jgi:hypothetical protein
MKPFEIFKKSFVFDGLEKTHETTHNPKVACSNQAPATKYIKGLGDAGEAPNPFLSP